MPQTALTPLEIQKKILNAILDNIKEGVILVDSNKKITLFNQSASQITEYLEGEVLGKHVGEILKCFDNNGEISSDEYCPAVEFARDGIVFEKEGVKIITKLNENKVVNIVSRKVKEGFDIDLGCIIAIENTFESEELERMKLDFTSMTTHVLRTPATVARGYITKFMTEKTLSKLDDEEIEFLNHAVAASDDLKAQIENLLNLSEIFEGKFLITAVTVNIDEVIKRMVEKYSPKAKEKGLSISYITPLYEVPSVKADIVRLEELLRNLIENAIKFTDKGKIEINISKDKDFITVSIKDTGKGIEKKYQPYLFTKFFRVKTPLEMVTGNGLGLYISKKIVESFGGKIWVESVENEGSTFSFTLPINP